MEGMAQCVSADIVSWDPEDKWQLPQAIERVNDRFALGLAGNLALDGKIEGFLDVEDTEDVLELLKESWESIRANMGETIVSGQVSGSEHNRRTWSAIVMRHIHRNTPFAQRTQFLAREMIDLDYDDIEQGVLSTGAVAESHFREAVLQSRTTGMRSFDRLFHAMYIMACYQYFAVPLAEVREKWEKIYPGEAFYSSHFIEDRQHAPSTLRTRFYAAAGKVSWMNTYKSET